MILFDDLTSALDQQLVGKVLNTMKQLAREGATMIVVFQDGLRGARRRPRGVHGSQRYLEEGMHAAAAARRPAKPGAARLPGYVAAAQSAVPGRSHGPARLTSRDGACNGKDILVSDALRPSCVPRLYGDVPPFMAADHVRDLSALAADAVIVGMPYDGLATYRGGATRRAPQRSASFRYFSADTASIGTSI